MTTKPIPAKTTTPATKPVVATKAPAAKAPTKPVAKAASKPALIKAKIATTAPKKPEKEKKPKLKMERDSFTMPKAEYAQIYVLKERLVKLGQPAKKSELLRAGLMLLSALNDAELKANMAKIPAIKTGRPKK